MEQALQRPLEVPGEELSPRHRVVPWYPVMPVKLVPSNAGGDTTQPSSGVNAPFLRLALLCYAIRAAEAEENRSLALVDVKKIA